jgi:ribonuclease HI
MICTINTDASHHPHFKVGSYAFWVVSDEFRIKKASVFKDPMLRCSDEAEIKCIINALWLTLRESDSISRVIINTDSQHAIYVFEHNRKMTGRYRLGRYKKYRQKYNDICRKYRKKSGVDIKNSIEFRKVAAHDNTDTPRNYVNQWCDDRAKEQLWNYIDKNLR